VWAARDYREGTFEWQSRFRRLIERVNGDVGRWPGVRFEVVETKTWACESAKYTMESLLDEVERVDRGDDVDLVIALVAAVPVMPSAIHNLGMARILGKHVVLRSLHDLMEVEDVRQVFDELSEAERAKFLATRKAHKEEVIFLHEWGHTLGVPHSAQSASIMNATYSASMARLSEADARVIDVSVARADGWRERLRAVLEVGDADWEPRDRAQALRLLSGPTRTAAPAPAASPAAETFDREDAKVLDAANEAARAGRLDEAWELAARVEKKVPQSAQVRLFVCSLAMARPDDVAKAPLVESACKAAAEVAPRDPLPELGLALVTEPARRQAHLARAEELLTAAGEARTAEWAELARRYAQLNLPTAAARAAEKADTATRAEVYFSLGLLAARTARVVDAVTHLQRAIELDPQREASWQLLAQVYSRAGKKAELTALRARHQKELGRPLSPAR
jgi:tetratricopeptide (TPR) repeat protein